MRTKYIPLLLILAVLAGMLAGCGDTMNQKTEVTEEGIIIIYDTDNATDSMNYANYANKEIDLVMNILSTHIANADNVTKGKYILSDELDAVISDLDRVAEAVDSVEGLNPPNKYEDDRDAILERLTNAQGTLEAYRDALEDGETGLQDYIDLMEGDYVALSGVFNLPWE